MKEGIGGVFVLQAIVVAMIIITCLLAFSVNYTKAFRVKNEIRNIADGYGFFVGVAIVVGRARNQKGAQPDQKRQRIYFGGHNRHARSYRGLNRHILRKRNFGQ